MPPAPGRFLHDAATGLAMLNILMEDREQVVPPEHQQVVEALLADGSRPAKAFALGARMGVLRIRTPSVRNTSSKGPENLESRSRIRNLTPRRRSTTARLRACWTAQAEFGFLVTPRTCARLVPTSIANRTYRLHREEVHRQDSLSLGPEELAPRGTAPSWSRRKTRPPKDRADRGGADADAELAKFALDADASHLGSLVRVE
jgi:hypothetical protein